MREIKFRGKMVEDNEWIFGYYVVTCDSHRIIYEDYEGFYCEDEVIPESVGQYTGIKDKNGRNIYEGDVVDYIVFDHFDRDTQHRGIVKWDKQEAAYYLANVDGSDFHGSYIHYLGWVSCRDPELEVIGNIYENPELLEEK